MAQRSDNVILAYLRRDPVRAVVRTLGAAAAIAAAYFLAARLGLALLLARSDVAVFWPASGIAAGILIVSGHRTAPALMTAEGGSPGCRAARSAKRIVIEDIEAETLFIAFRPMARAAGYRALQSTPIMNREGMLLGTLATHFRSVHKPDTQDLRLLDLYVRQAAEIIERHEAETSLRETEERLRGPVEEGCRSLGLGPAHWKTHVDTGAGSSCRSRARHRETLRRFSRPGSPR